MLDYYIYICQYHRGDRILHPILSLSALTKKVRLGSVGFLSQLDSYFRGDGAHLISTRFAVLLLILVKCVGITVSLLPSSVGDVLQIVRKP